MGVGPTSRSSMVPGWKGGKALPFGGSFGEYSLNDFEEQPGRERKKGSSESQDLSWKSPRLCGQGLVFQSPQSGWTGDRDDPKEQVPLLLNLASILFYHETRSTQPY